MVLVMSTSRQTSHQEWGHLPPTLIIEPLLKVGQISGFKHRAQWLNYWSHNVPSYWKFPAQEPTFYSKPALYQGPGQTPTLTLVSFRSQVGLLIEWGVAGDGSR